MIKSVIIVNSLALNVCILVIFGRIDICLTMPVVTAAFKKPGISGNLGSS